jgi:prevent-host-death family protein
MSKISTLPAPSDEFTRRLVTPQCFAQFPNRRKSALTFSRVLLFKPLNEVRPMVRSGGVNGSLSRTARNRAGDSQIAHQCAVMYNLIDGDRPSMKSLSFTEFRKRASEILTLVEKGETVRVIRHGKTVAKIVPAETEEKIPSWKRPGLRLVRPGASLSKAILEERRKSR